ncbi:hypothetical protein PG996_008763 [Apiospora saccharicola]|uniref:Uncharacterized protein n=1 Tax=Apiospora saccharicola TaxID=335842 RepID=A0ABR1UYU0_9PEZI
MRIESPQDLHIAPDTGLTQEVEVLADICLVAGGAGVEHLLRQHPIQEDSLAALDDASRHEAPLGLVELKARGVDEDIGDADVPAHGGREHGPGAEDASPRVRPGRQKKPHGLLAARAAGDFQRGPAAAEVPRVAVALEGPPRLGDVGHEVGVARAAGLPQAVVQECPPLVNAVLMREAHPQEKPSDVRMPAADRQGDATFEVVPIPLLGYWEVGWDPAWLCNGSRYQFTFSEKGKRGEDQSPAYSIIDHGAIQPHALNRAKQNPAMGEYPIFFLIGHPTFFGEDQTQDPGGIARDGVQLSTGPRNRPYLLVGSVQ